MVPAQAEARPSEESAAALMASPRLAHSAPSSFAHSETLQASPSPTPPPPYARSFVVRIRQPEEDGWKPPHLTTTKIMKSSSFATQRICAAKERVQQRI